MSELTRRSVSKGAAWAVPAITVASAAPAVAASPCSGIIKGSPLPASAFVPVYLAVTNQTFGGAANKQISVIAGVKIAPAIVSCIGAAALTLAASSGTSRITQTNGTTYNVTGGTESSGSGTAGRINGGCGGGDNTAEVCITNIGMTIAASTGTSSANPRQMSFLQNITVAGYGTTAISINAASFALSGTTWNGSGLSITSAPVI